MEIFNNLSLRDLHLLSFKGKGDCAALNTIEAPANLFSYKAISQGEWK